MSKGFVNSGAFFSLFFARIVYAANFYNIAAVFAFIAADLGENVGGLGLLSSGFLLGIGLFQIPCGLFAARYGPKKSAAYGTLLSSIAATLTGLAPSVLDIAVLRFTVGLGMAFVFAPGIALTARYFRKGSEGLAIGIYNSTFSLGSVVGLSGWAVLAQLVGWRAALLAGGLLGVATGLMLVIFVPADEESRDFRIKVQDLLHILLDRRLLLVGAGLLGINMALNLVNNFVVYYLEVNLSVPPVYAASVASLTWISGLFVSLVAGRLYDKIKSIRGLFFAAGIFSTAGMVVISYPLAYASVLGAVLVGSAVGIASTAGFSIAREAGREHPRYESLSISWVNSINYFGSFWSTLVFSYLALVLGYSLAWLVMGIAIFPSVLPFMLFRLNKETSRAPVSTASV